MDFLIHWPPGPVVATVQCQGLPMFVFYLSVFNTSACTHARHFIPDQFEIGTVCRGLQLVINSSEKII